MEFKFKKEKVYILKKNKKGTGFVKQLAETRTFEYKGHKFNLQGDSRGGYAVSDNATGMLIGAYFNKLKELENYLYILDNFIDIVNTDKKNTLYKDALKDFEKAKYHENEKQGPFSAKHQDNFLLTKN